MKLVNWDLYLVPWEQHVFSKILNLGLHGMKLTMLAVWKHSLPPHYQVQPLQMWLLVMQKRKLLLFQHQVRSMSSMIFRIVFFKASLCKVCTCYDMRFSWHWLCGDVVFRDVTPRLHSVTFHKTVTFLLYSGVKVSHTQLQVTWWAYCDSWGSHSSVDEHSALLGHYAVFSGSYQLLVTVYQSRFCNTPKDLNLHDVHSLIIFGHWTQFIQQALNCLWYVPVNCLWYVPVICPGGSMWNSPVYYSCKCSKISFFLAWWIVS